MPRQSSTLRPYNTSVRSEGRKVIVRLYSTDIVVIDFAAGTVTYSTGGWSTPTTVRRMQEAAKQYSLPMPPTLKDWRGMAEDSVTRSLTV